MIMIIIIIVTGSQMRTREDMRRPHAIKPERSLRALGLQMLPSQDLNGHSPFIVTKCPILLLLLPGAGDADDVTTPKMCYHIPSQLTLARAWVNILDHTWN